MTTIKAAREHFYNLTGIRHRSKTPPHSKFISKPEWKELRDRVIAHYGARCMRCGGCDNITVDHIKPKSKHPELALSFDNLQVLCWPCNKHKNTNDMTDYRPPLIRSCQNTGSSSLNHSF